jgi:uncharacterized membrane protein YcaP (DUF421 family)
VVLPRQGMPFVTQGDAKASFNEGAMVLITNLLNMTAELVIGLTALFLVTKVLGTTQISQITPFHFVSALVLGELLGNAIYERETGLVYVLVALTVWTALLLTIEWTSRRFLGTRGFLQGKPAILIRKGKLDRDELSRSRMNIHELQGLLRKQGVFSVREAAYAILESDGSISVLRTPESNVPTKQDLQLPCPDVYLPVTLIVDGEVLRDNLKEARLSEQWLMEQLQAYGDANTRTIFYAEWQQGKGLLVQRQGRSEADVPPSR